MYYESAVDLMDKYHLDCYCGSHTINFFVWYDKINDGEWIIDVEEVKETMLNG